MGFKTFKVTAMDDVVYIEAIDAEDAARQIQEKIGPVPSRMLSFTEVDSLPEDEEYL